MSILEITPSPTINQLIERCGYASAALTILPIPGSEIIGVMPLHVGMVVGIAEHHGQSITKETGMEILVNIGTTVGASLITSRLATTAAKILLPGLGGLVAAPFMFASTLAIGAVADHFFRTEGAASESTLKDLYKQTMGKAKSGYQADKASTPEATEEAKAAVKEAKSQPKAPSQDAPTPTIERLKKAKELLDAGLIDADEYELLKRRVLDSI